jgi:hypothetical protein
MTAYLVQEVFDDETYPVCAFRHMSDARKFVDHMVLKHRTSYVIVEITYHDYKVY